VWASSPSFHSLPIRRSAWLCTSLHKKQLPFCHRMGGCGHIRLCGSIRPSSKDAAGGRRCQSAGAYGIYLAEPRIRPLETNGSGLPHRPPCPEGIFQLLDMPETSAPRLEK
jgi:hypothetical protein